MVVCPRFVKSRWGWISEDSAAAREALSRELMAQIRPRTREEYIFILDMAEAVYEPA